MRNDQSIEDVAMNLISKEMARSSHSFNQNLETPGCLIKLQSRSTSERNGNEAKKENGNQPVPDSIVSTTPFQTSRECQTRFTEILKKSSMNQHAQIISAMSTQRAKQISPTVELDLPQSGSEDDDET